MYLLSQLRRVYSLRVPTFATTLALIAGLCKVQGIAAFVTDTHRKFKEKNPVSAEIL